MAALEGEIGGESWVEVGVLEGDEVPVASGWQVEHVEVFALASSEVDCVERSRAGHSGPAELDRIDVRALPSIGAHGQQPPEASACRRAAAILDTDADPQPFAAVLALAAPAPGLGRLEGNVDPRSA